MSEIRWTDKVFLDNQGNIHNLNEQHKKHKLSEGQIQNLEDDGFFDDISAENYRLSVELYYED